MGIVVSIVLMYAGHIIENVFRLFVGLSYLFILLYVIILQYILVQILMKLKLLYIPILLVGAGKLQNWLIVIMIGCLLITIKL